MKIVIAVWFVMIMLAGGIIGFMVANMLVEKTGVKADTEPNNDFDQAELIVPGTYNGSLIGFDTADVYKFNVTGGQTITVKFTSSVAGNYAQQMGLHNQTRSEVLHLSSKNNVTNTGTYNVSCDIGIVYFYIMVNAGPPGQEAKGDYSFQLQIGTAGNETETAALAATWLKELNISPQTDGNFCGMNAYDLQLDGWGTDVEIRGCILSQGVSGFYSNTTVYNRAMEILNATYYKKTKWMADGGIGLSRDVTSVFAWNLIHPTKGGGYYFSVSDKAVSSAQSMDANIIGSIMPIAIWDQHDAGNMPNSNTIELYQNGSFFCIGNTTGPIGNLSAYADFIKATVERYDCDGIGDMPGLKYGIKYWEVWNEPESPGGGFKGKPGNYTQLLNATYNAVKSACADAIVVSGGALEVYNLTITQQFWKDVFALGGGNYFDVMNIHYNTERNEQAHTSFTQYNYTIEFFRNLTSGYGMLKPMWITEIGTYTGTPLGYSGYLPYQSEQFQASWMVKHYVYGLEKNVIKFFWDLQVAPGDSVFFTNEGKCQLCYYTHKLMIYKLGNFTSAEKLADGQYKFMVDGKNVYVLWGNGSIPSEITGTVNVTNIFGNVTQTSASSIILSDEPAFVEVLSTSNASESSHFGYLGNIQGLGVLPPLGGVPWSDALYRPVYPTYFSPFDEVGFKWDRPHPGPFNWNITERAKGVYNWSLPDDYVKQAQQHGVQIIATIWPFVEWDQAYWKTQPGWNGSSDEWLADIPSSRYKPNDTVAYKNFVQTMVERYDGDGASDMPGLQYPVKYWEILNEPESGQATGQGAEKAFFRGTVADYMDVLNETATAIWAANSNAYIVNGGAGADLNSFWTNVLDSGGSQYFDIGNWHYLAQPQEMGDLNAGTWLNLFNPYGITRVWNTEYSIFVGQKPGSDVFITEQDQAERFVKGHVQAFSAGAEKIFYIMFSQKDCGLINSTNNQTRPSYYAAKTVIQKLDYFTAVSNISDSNKRAYKFTVNGSCVYVLWGSGGVPSEITGNVKVTNILGNVTQTSASSIVLSDEPIFVEEVTAGAENRDPTLWRKDAGIRINGSVPWVMQLPNGTYRMYYTDMGSIYSALSTDSLSWTAESGTRLTPGTGTEACIGDSSVIRLSNGTYRMYYQASEDFSTHHYIASAWSQDGLSWSREGIRYNSTGTPDNGFAGTPDVIQLPNGSYRMYYVGNGGNATCALFSADTLNWAREGVVLGPIALDPHVIQLHDGAYRMFYTRPKPPDIVGNLRIETAYSADGLIWARESGVKLYPDSVYDSSVLMDPCAIELPNGTYRVYYGGANETKTQILSAWAKYLPNQTFWTNTALSNAFNLNDYFHDPDGDTITYTAYNSMHINATIADNGSVSFSAVPDWYGKENITFSAADDKGGYTSELPSANPRILRTHVSRCEEFPIPKQLTRFARGYTEETIAVTVTKACSHAPIYINGNADFSDADDDGVSNLDAAGTQADPYIIENWDINASTAHGIEIRNTNVYFIIRNCVIHDGKTNYNHGIYFNSVQNGKIDNVTSYNNNYGIELFYSSNNNISNCSVYYNNYWGIELGYSSNNQISNCDVYNNSCGIYLGYSSNNQISNCSVYNNYNGIYLYYSSNNKLRNNVLNNNTYNFGVYGWDISHYYQDIDTSNTINGKPIYYIKSQTGLIFNNTMSIGYLGLVSCTNIKVENLTFVNNIQGILLANTSYSTISNCAVYNNYYVGIWLYYSSNNQISNCAVYNNSGDGIRLYYSSNNQITNCAVYNNKGYGIGLGYYSNNNTITNCAAYNNSDDGIWLYSSSNNTITDCAVYNNYYVGIWLYYSSNNQITNCTAYNNSYGIYLYSSSNNEIHYNNIYNNTNYGVYNYNSEAEYQVNATLNWWGSADGPGGVGSGSGDAVSGNVLYEPWLTEPLDLLPPSIESTQPSNGAIDVSVDVEIVITFSEPMDTSTIPGNVTIEPEIQIQDYIWSDGNKTLTLILTSNLTSYTQYTITINTNVKDAATVTDSNGVAHSIGNYLQAPYHFSFKTKDVTPPIANAGDDLIVNEDELVELNASLSWDNVGITVWTWNFTDQGVPVYLYSGATHYTFTQPGYYVITLNVSDAAGNWAVDVLNITVKDVTLPVISNIQANPQTQVQGGYVNITCAVTDNVGIAVVKVNITGSLSINETATNIPGTHNYYYNSTYPTAGTYSYYIWAVDTSDNENKSLEHQFTISVKVTTITTTIEGKEVAVTYSGDGTVTIEAAVAPGPTPENLGAMGLFVHISATGNVTEAFITINYTDQEIAGLDENSLKMYYWNETTNEWTLISDSGVWTNNNTVWARVTHLTIFAPMGEKISVNLPPTVNITHPLEGQTVNGTITIAGTSSDTDGVVTKVEIKINNGYWQLATGTTTWSFIWNTTTVPNGGHTIYARAYDGLNYSDVKAVNVNVLNPIIVQVFPEPTTGANITAGYTGYGELNVIVAVTPPQIPPEFIGIGIYTNVTAPETMSIHWLYIEVPYNETLLPQGVKEDDLLLYYWNETSKKWESCAKIGTTSVDTDRNIVWANVTHLTIFAPMAEKIAETPPINWLLYIGILAAAIIIVIAVVVIARLRKKQR